MISRIKNRIQREAFLTTYLSVFINPFFIIRHGLHTAIEGNSAQISGNILDFGCGSKPYETLFTGATSYTGTDIKGAGNDHNTSKINVFYNGKTLPFSDRTFDAVVSFEVLEHVFNLDEILIEIRRVLKPNGKLLITTPFAWDEHMVPYDYARYTSYGIRHLLEKHNFEVIKIEKTTTTVLAICQMFIAYIAQHLSPKKKPLRQFFQLAIIFPLNLIAIFLNFLLPKRYEYFCNTVSIAKKK